MKIKKLLIPSLSALLALGLCTPIICSSIKDKEIGEDNITYQKEPLVNIVTPHFASTDDEEEDEVVSVDKVILHYVNEDNACSTRAFYIWCTGVDGVEYSDANASDIVTYSEKGDQMQIVIDIKNDTRFSSFAGLGSLMYIIKYKKVSDSNLNWGGQSDDVELKYANFDIVNKEVEVWSTPAAGGGIAQFKTEAETKVDGIKKAFFSDFKTIEATATDGCSKVDWTLYAFDETFFKVKAKEREPLKKNYIVKTGTQDVSSNKVFQIKFKYDAHINVVYSLVSKESSSTSPLTKTVFVTYEKLYQTDRFEKYYTYKTLTNNRTQDYKAYDPSSNDLGMTFDKTNKKVTIKVWAPTAANMSVLLYEKGTPVAFADKDHAGTDKYKGYHMTYTPGGVWTLNLTWDEDNKSPEGKYYAIQVDNTLGTQLTMDPYATACGVNGLRALIYDKAKGNPDGWNDLSVCQISTPQQLTPYEVHIQDFTGDSSWNGTEKPGTYKAFVESGTHLRDDSSISTGYDHLNELGVNAVQLMPVFDHDNDETGDVLKYNWGYNPLNYNCVDGAYSSDPYDGLTRIKEFKQMILQLSKTEAKTRTIMDVVYNHVSSASSSCFNKLMPRYFFRYTPEGELYDGSGCHNEVKSEATMMRKFIIDSLYMWASEYKIKGFRFDLMGLLDTETMAAAQSVLYKVDPSIFIYGEGWTSGGFNGGYDYENNKDSVGTFCCNGLGNAVYSDLYARENQIYLGGFNDAGRNGLKGGNDQGWGSTNSLPGSGWIQNGDEGNFEKVGDMIWGIHTGVGGNPRQTINYASCHDNWTLRDQLYQTLGKDGHPSYSYDLLHSSITAHSLIFASNGVGFMLGGEELLRTKDIEFVSEFSSSKSYKMDQFVRLDNELYKCTAPTFQGEFDSKYWSKLNTVVTTEMMYGHKLSHNSYNLPVEVNSFKWGNKKSIEIDVGTAGKETIDATNISSWEYKGDTHGTPMSITKIFANLIKFHKESPKYKLDDATEMRNFHKANEGGSTAGICSYIGDYVLFASAQSFGYFKDSRVNTFTVQAGMTTGTYGIDLVNGSINVGDESFGGSAFVICSYVA